jgi:CelD/BcsL family acetyltransferase involved in cellulose biosynthesis
MVERPDRDVGFGAHDMHCSTVKGLKRLVSVNYHGDLNEVQGDPYSQALLDAQTTPFDRPEWWRALVAHCGLTPLIVLARDGDDRAILPLRSEAGGLHALANWYSFTAGPLFTPGADRARLLMAMAADLARRHHQLTLYPVADEGGDAAVLARCFRAAGWQVDQQTADTNHILAVAGRSYAEYIASRPGQLRSTLKRKAARVAVTIHCRFDDDAWQAYEDVYGQSWKPDEGSPAFLRAFARAEGAAGRLRMGIARADGQPVAAQFWTVEGGTAYIHKLAHTEESRPLSPGTTLSAALFEQVIDRDGVTLVDFGTGDDPYKRDWMDAVRPRYRLTMLRPADPRNWIKIARTGLRRLAGRVRHG